MGRRVNKQVSSVSKQPFNPFRSFTLKLLKDPPQKYLHIPFIKTFSLNSPKEILQYVTTRMNLEDITLSEISQSHKDVYYMIPLT